MTERLITLYHGTTIDMVDGEDIIGIDYPNSQELSGNLTDKKEFAQIWALKRASYDSDRACVLEFKYQNLLLSIMEFFYMGVDIVILQTSSYQ